MTRPFSLRHLALAVLAIGYAARPSACGYVLGRFSRMDDTPYARFDGHGVSNGYGLLGALLCAYPLWWLARRLLVPANEPDAPPSSRRRPAGSAAVAVAIALPSFVQIDYMLHLPFALMWPVVASAAIWAGLIAALWLWCRRSSDGRRNMAAVGYRAIGVAVLVTAPKLMILAM